MAAELSKDALQELRQHMDAAMAQPMPAPAGAEKFAAAAAGGGADFCSIWPNVKPVLQAVVGIIVFIPGLGTAAATALNGLLAVGDQIFKATCKA